MKWKLVRCFTLLAILPMVRTQLSNNGELGEEEGPTPPEHTATTIKPFVAGCSELDHRSCDDVCKGDSFWYGYCSLWDGIDLQCRCVEYGKPLDGQVCSGMQEECAQRCRDKGQDSGYCAVFPSASIDQGEAKCMCFDKPALN